MNKSLYDKEIEFPRNMREHMRVSLGKVGDVDKDSEGYKRNQELQGKKFISYKQLKRIKNFFDNFKGNQNEPSFILNGGVEIKNWVDNELRKMRDYIKNTKTNKMDAGMMNQFIDPHEKKDFTNVRTSQEHSKTVDKYNPSVNESVKRINELISKI